MRLTVVLEKSVSCDKRLVDFLDDSSKRRLRVSILLAVLADRGRPLCPLFLSPTLPVSLNFSRRCLIVRFAGRISSGKVPPELSLSEDYRFCCKICLHNLSLLLHSVSSCWIHGCFGMKI